MLKIQNGKCMIHTNNGVKIERVQGVQYKESAVFVYIPDGVAIGQYIGAYIIVNNKVIRFGEIKFTTGIINRGLFSGNYVLCEY